MSKINPDIVIIITVIIITVIIIHFYRFQHHFLCRINLLAILAIAKGPAALEAPRLSDALVYKKKRKKNEEKNIDEDKIKEKKEIEKKVK